MHAIGGTCSGAARAEWGILRRGAAPETAVRFRVGVWLLAPCKAPSLCRLLSGCTGWYACSEHPCIASVLTKVFGFGWLREHPYGPPDALERDSAASRLPAQALGSCVGACGTRGFVDQARASSNLGGGNPWHIIETQPHVYSYRSSALPLIVNLHGFNTATKLQHNLKPSGDSSMS